MKVFDVPIAKINVPGERFRQAFNRKKLDELKDSIKRLGLLNPLTVEPETNGEWVLVAGERRLRALLELGWTAVPVHEKGDIDELTHREIEIEENLARDDMTPQERVAAIAEIHRLKRASNSNWTHEQTATLIGASRRADVTDALRVEKMLNAFPELRTRQVKSFMQLTSIVDAKAKSMLRRMTVDDAQRDGNQSPAEAAASSHIWLGDSVDLIKLVPDEQFHLILTDPPFGVDYDQKITGTVGELSAYEDSEVSYQRLLSMAGDLYRVLRKDGWLIWFYGAQWYGDRMPSTVDPVAFREAAEALRAKKIHPLQAAAMLENVAEYFEDAKFGVVSAFSAAGFIVDPLPIVWDRTEGKTFTRTPDRRFTRGYDLAIMARKGEPNIVRRNLSNVLHIKPVQSTDREALVERPVELYEELITRLTVPGEWVADFFVGSGSCPAAAAKQRRNYFGCELDPERRALAVTKVRLHTPAGFTPATAPWLTDPATSSTAGEDSGPADQRD